MACGLSLVKVAIINYSFCFLMYNEAFYLEFGARTTLVNDNTSPAYYPTLSALKT